MTDPVIFESVSPRFALPLLYSGQAQKELFVNEALLLSDVLLHCAVHGETPTPPATPAEGEAWLVGAGATGEWAGKDQSVACRHGGNWRFIAPRDGMRIFCISSRQEQLFHGTWKKAPQVQEPVGGSTVDAEARAAVNSLISALQAMGILPTA
jgi:hypothetical protein